MLCCPPWLLPRRVQGGATEEKARRESTSGGKLAKDLASVLFCLALAQGVAYPLGLDAAAALAMGIQACHQDIYMLPCYILRLAKFLMLRGIVGRGTYSCTRHYEYHHVIPCMNREIISFFLAVWSERGMKNACCTAVV